MAVWASLIVPASRADRISEPVPRLPAGVAAPDGKTVYVANHTGGIDALELSTGKLKWSLAGLASPVLATGDRVLVPVVAPDYKQFTLVTLDPVNGTRLRESAPIKLYDLKAQADSKITVEIVAQSESSTVVMACWRITATCGLGLSSSQGRSRVNMDTGLVEAAPRDERQVAVNAALEKPFAVVNFGGRKFQVIETADGKLNTKRVLRATDLATGKLAWEHALADVTGRPLVRPIRFPGAGLASADGMIGFVERTIGNGGIDALDLRTGQTLWQSKGTEQPLFAIDGALLAADWRQGGTELVVVWLDPATGRPLRESDAQPLLRPPALPSFRAEASLRAADGQLMVWWMVNTRQQFGAAGLAESMSISGRFRVALETGKISDASSARGRQGFFLENVLGPGELERQKINGLEFSIASTTETRPDVIVTRRTLRATDATGKVAWEHPLAPWEHSTHQPPRSAPR